MTVASGAHSAPAGPASAQPTSGLWRWVRGGAVGVSATGLAVAGHVLTGGTHPPVAWLVVLGLAAVAASAGLSGHRWTLGPLLSVLLGVQAVFHVAFADLAGPTSAGHSGPLHDHVAHQAMAGQLVGWRMVAGHLLAAVITALLLRRGEAWCWRLAALLGELLAGPVRVARMLSVSSAPRPALSLPGLSTYPLPASRLLVYAQPRRGPPAEPAC